MSDKGLPILQVKVPKKTEKLPPEPLPPHAFLWGIVAPPRSGKSNMLMTLIGASHMYGRDYFHEIYVFSPSQRFDSTTRYVLPKLDNVIQIDDPDQIENADILVRSIMKQQADEDPDERKRILLIFDDMAGTLERNKVLQKLCTKYRHYHISIIISVQQYKSIPVMIRNCMTCFTHFHIPSEKEYVKMNEEIHDRFPNGPEIAKQASQKRYNFCFINIEKATMHKNFDELLYSKDEDPNFD
jgi:hypothetical protein